MGDPTQFVAALDVGTTTVRCFIYDSNLQIRGKALDEVELIYPQPGYVEIEPQKLWESVCKTIRNAIRDANIQPSDISCLGISTQRSTFITWDKDSGKVFHNFITWKDLRADSLVRKWNSSLILNTMHGISYCMYLLTRSKRYLAASVLKMMNTQTTLRLAWMMQNNQDLKAAVDRKSALFGTMDSWLLYRLRGGGRPKHQTIEHISDVTSCAATGFYDPFTMSWGNWALTLFGIRREMLPKVVDNSYNFGMVDESLFGHSFPIGSSMGDQAASMWGSCCFNRGDIKVTLGTGSFLNFNTGKTCHASVCGLYPLVAWSWKDRNANAEEMAYCMEGASSDTGSIIRWALDFGLFSDPSESSDIAFSVPDSDGVYFIPAFSGLGAPINDHQAASGLIGLKASTKRAHLVRAVLESIAYRITQLYSCTTKETDFAFSVIRVDGGVSKNDFICQLIADLTRLPVERPYDSELSVLGAGFMAGLNIGVWTTRNDLVKRRKIDRIFDPNWNNYEQCSERMLAWERAVGRFKGWYKRF